MNESTINQLNRPSLSFLLKFIRLNCVYILIFYVSFLFILILFTNEVIFYLYNESNILISMGFLEYMMARVGMRAKWMVWMKAYIFGWSMPILVNGSPTVEIDIQRRLKQGDPLALFILLLVAEYFSGVMRNVVNRNLFNGFKIKNEGMGISHLQFADNTLCIGKASVDNH